MTAQLSQSTTDITTLIEKFSKELPLRQAEGSWAGSAYIDVKLSQGDRSSLIVNSWREWSKNGKWSGNSSRHILNLVEGDTFATIGGLLTIYKERDNLTACPCLWYEQSRGFEVKEKKGFLVDGYHIEKTEKVSSLEKAIEQVAKRIKIATQKSDILTAKKVMKQFAFCESGVKQFCEINNIDFANGRLNLEELSAIVAKKPEYNQRVYAIYLRKLGLSI